MLTFLLLILTINSRVYIFKERFTGCTSPLFKKTFNFIFFKIDFSEACTNLETCAKDTSKTQSECIRAFNSEMDEFCGSYARKDRWRRRYCFKIANQNKLVATELENDLFKYIEPVDPVDPVDPVCEIETEKAFNGDSFISFGNALEDGNCLDFNDSDELSLTSCSDDNSKQNWVLFVDKKLDGNSYFKDDNGHCLTAVLKNNKMVTEVCNFCNENQIFNTENDSEFFNLIKNVATEKYLDLDNDTNPDFSDDGNIIYSISS